MPLSDAGGIVQSTRRHKGEQNIDTGQKAKARRTLKKARAMCQEMGMDYWLAKAEKALEKLLG